MPPRGQAGQAPFGARRLHSFPPSGFQAPVPVRQSRTFSHERRLNMRFRPRRYPSRLDSQAFAKRALPRRYGFTEQNAIDGAKMDPLSQLAQDTAIVATIALRSGCQVKTLRHALTGRGEGRWRRRSTWSRNAERRRRLVWRKLPPPPPFRNRRRVVRPRRDVPKFQSNYTRVALTFAGFATESPQQMAGDTL
jgi:hypothetical protein